MLPAAEKRYRTVGAAADGVGLCIRLHRPYLERHTAFERGREGGPRWVSMCVAIYAIVVVLMVVGCRAVGIQFLGVGGLLDVAGCASQNWKVFQSQLPLFLPCRDSILLCVQSNSKALFSSVLHSFLPNAASALVSDSLDSADTDATGATCLANWVSWWK